MVNNKPLWVNGHIDHIPHGFQLALPLQELPSADAARLASVPAFGNVQEKYV